MAVAGGTRRSISVPLQRIRNRELSSPTASLPTENIFPALFGLYRKEYTNGLFACRSSAYAACIDSMRKAYSKRRDTEAGELIAFTTDGLAVPYIPTVYIALAQSALGDCVSARATVQPMAGKWQNHLEVRHLLAEVSSRCK